MAGIKYQFTTLDCDMFLPIEVSSKDGNNAMLKVSMRDWREKLLGFKITGTTFSGHPTRTTLGNTLRSITYCKLVL